MTDAGAPCECFFFGATCLGPVYHYSVCDYALLHVIISAMALVLVIFLFYEETIVIPGLFVVVFGPTGLLFWLLYIFYRKRARTYPYREADTTQQQTPNTENKLSLLLKIYRSLNISAHAPEGPAPPQYSALRCDIFK